MLQIRSWHLLLSAARRPALQRRVLRLNLHVHQSRTCSVVKMLCKLQDDLKELLNHPQPAGARAPQSPEPRNSSAAKVLQGKLRSNETQASECKAPWGDDSCPRSLCPLSVCEPFLSWPVTLCLYWLQVTQDEYLRQLRLSEALT